MLRGGCFCGNIRYEAVGTPFNETNCHCSICRRTTGAPFVTWFSNQARRVSLRLGYAFPFPLDRQRHTQLLSALRHPADIPTPRHAG